MAMTKQKAATRPVDRLCSLIAQTMRIGSRYTDAVEKLYNPLFHSLKTKKNHLILGLISHKPYN